MPKKTERADKEFNFQEAYQELEDVIAWFERDDLDLEEGLAKFERGLELAKRCQERLAKVNQRVEEINAKFSDLAKEPRNTKLIEDDADEPAF